MKKILTVGVYDYFHLGHLRLFENCKKYGDYLIVAVQESNSVLKYKKEAKLLYSTSERIEIISNLRVVDEVITYHDVDSIVNKIEFDIFAVGEDQIHDGFQRALLWCESNGKKVIRMKRTQGISSSNIKAEVFDDFVCGGNK